MDDLVANTTESQLIDLFSAYGSVKDVNIVVDRTSHKPCGFVKMVTPEADRDSRSREPNPP
jgi:RNA recognition motif-containing protein